MALLMEIREETQGLQEELDALESQAVAAMQQDEVSAVELDSLLVEISDVRLEMSKIAVAKMLDAKSVLSEEQQEVFFRTIGEMRRMGRGGKPFMKKRWGDGPPRKESRDSGER